MGLTFVKKQFVQLFRFFSDCCARINAIYVANGVPLVWSINPRSQRPDNTIPDFVLKPPGGGLEVMVGEGKVSRVEHLKNEACFSKSPTTVSNSAILIFICACPASGVVCLCP